MRTWVWAALGTGAAAAAVAASRRRGTPGSGRHILHQAITIAARPQQVYQLWRDPATHARIRDLHVAALGDDARRWHWRRELPRGGRIEWESEITHEQPPRRLEWTAHNGQHWSPARAVARSLAVLQRGVLTLRPTWDGSQTELRLVVELTAPQDLAWVRPWIAHSVARALRRLKQLAETGELATTAGQPAGARPGWRPKLPHHALFNFNPQREGAQRAS